MKNGFYSILLFAAISVLFAACTGGAYDASPSSNANLLVNPLTPLKSSQFTWGVGATGSMGGTINGAAWVAASTSWSFINGGNQLIGYNGSQVMNLFLANTWAGNIYSMTFHQYNSACTWSDSVGSSYYSYPSYLGNSGEVYITENDSAFIRGMFYCEGVTPSGQIVAINNGYFNIAK